MSKTLTIVRSRRVDETVRFVELFVRPFETTFTSPPQSGLTMIIIRGNSSARHIPVFSEESIMNNEIKWYYREHFNIIYNKLRKTMVFSRRRRIEVLFAKAPYNPFDKISDVKAFNFNWCLPLLDLILLFHHYITSSRNPRYYRDL